MWIRTHDGSRLNSAHIKRIAVEADSQDDWDVIAETIDDYKYHLSLRYPSESDALAALDKILSGNAVPA